LDTLTDQIYGTTLADKINNVPNTPSPNNYASDKDKDALNKALRELEATKNLATHYQSIAEDLETQKKEYDCKIAAFEDVSTTIYEQLQEATEKLNDGSTTKEARTITERALRTVRQIQREARTLIKGLEITLENAIRVGDQYAENAIVLRRIVDTLYNQFLEISDKNNYVSSKGMAVKVDERIRGNGSARQAITEGLDKRHGPSVSHSGNRSGWV
jgi:conjugal transfer/entry exclusion protein